MITHPTAKQAANANGATNAHLSPRSNRIPVSSSINPTSTGVLPDSEDYWHDTVRKHSLWGNLMAGGAGCEWYFGYKFAHNDLNCESWRSREHMWDLTRYALEFVRDHLPFARMSHHDELTSAEDDYCLADPGSVYAVYLPSGGVTDLDLGTSTDPFTIRWFNPRQGGPIVCRFSGSLCTAV